MLSYLYEGMTLNFSVNIVQWYDNFIEIYHYLDGVHSNPKDCWMISKYGVPLEITRMVWTLLSWTGYSGKSGSIPWLLVPWLHASPCHQHRQYRLWMINRSLPFTKKVFQLPATCWEMAENSNMIFFHHVNIKGYASGVMAGIPPKHYAVHGFGFSTGRAFISPLQWGFISRTRMRETCSCPYKSTWAHLRVYPNVVDTNQVWHIVPLLHGYQITSYRLMICS